MVHERPLLRVLIWCPGLLCWFAAWQTNQVSTPRAGLLLAHVVAVESRVAIDESGSRIDQALLHVRRGRWLSNDQHTFEELHLWVDRLSLPPSTRARVLLDVRPYTKSGQQDGPFRWPMRASGYARLLSDPVGVEKRTLADSIFVLRSRLRDALHDSLDRRTAGFVAALTLGDRGLINEPDRQSVQDAGAAHVLAVSGLHVGVVSILMLWLARRSLAAVATVCGRAQTLDLRRLAHGLVAPLALAHGHIAGGSPSALRASWMIAAAHVALLLGLRPSLRGILAVLPIVASAYDMSLLRRPSLALSFVACLVIAHTPPAVGTHMRRGLSWLRTSTSLSLRITVATAPIVLSCFGKLAWIGALSNVLFVPFASMLLVPAAYTQLALSAAGVGGWCRGVSVALCNLLFKTCEMISDAIPPIEVAPLSSLEVVAFAALSSAFFQKGKVRGATLAVFLACTAWPIVRPRLDGVLAPPLQVRFVDVGQGDATLIRTHAGYAMIDMGRTVHYGSDSTRVLRNDAIAHLLRAERIEQLDLLVISHAHPDHFVSWSTVFEQVDVHELWLPALGLLDESAHFRALVASAQARGTTVKLAPTLCGSPQRRLGVRFEVLGPCEQPEPADSLNDASLVLRLIHLETSVLFAGDIESKAEAALVANSKLGANIIKVPHHGSRTSSTEAFVRAVSPMLAIISAGPANRFGHPHAEVVARWNSVSCVLVTAQDGTVTLNSDGRHWTLPDSEQAKRCGAKLTSTHPK